jgi:O-methyltransferase domain
MMGANPRALYRILRALASAGIFYEMPNGQFEHTGLSECLRSGVPSSMRAWARLHGLESHHRLIVEMAHSVRTGEPVVERALGLPLWEYFGQHQDQAALCNESMTNFSSMEIAAILESYDFSSFRTLVDVGGGLGSLLIAILKEYSRVRGILMDLPAVIEAARKEISALDVADRCQLAGMNMFESIPPGGDLT